MKIALARLDNRLLHGIVATQWAPKTKAQRIMIIDDEVAGNEFLKNSMKIARPAGMAISIISLEVALQNFKSNKYEGQTIFIITKHVNTILRLVDEAKIDIPSLNVGATAQRKVGPDITVVNRFLTVSDEEKEQYRKLIDRGVEVYAQYLVADEKYSLNKIL